jgi:hypothetical protein
MDRRQLLFGASALGLVTQYHGDRHIGSPTAIT